MVLLYWSYKPVGGPYWGGEVVTADYTLDYPGWAITEVWR